MGWLGLALWLAGSPFREPFFTPVSHKKSLGLAFAIDPELTDVITIYSGTVTVRTPGVVVWANTESS